MHSMVLDTHLGKMNIPSKKVQNGKMNRRLENPEINGSQLLLFIPARNCRQAEVKNRVLI